MTEGETGLNKQKIIDIREVVQNGMKQLSENSQGAYPYSSSPEAGSSSESTVVSMDNLTVVNEQLVSTKIPMAAEPRKVRSGSKRIYWADVARIYSMLAIILLHCCGYGCEQKLRKQKNDDWIIICWYNCFTRFGVPMFVLLSGMFILDPSKNFSFKKLFKHNIFRLATAFTFWSTVNALLNIYLYKKNKPSQFFELFFVGEEYLWFIFMIIGCYLIAPVLRLFSDNIVIARYFLGLCVFWGSLVPTLVNIFNAWHLNGAKHELQVWMDRWHYHFTLEFVGYFVAGYHIVKHVNIQKVWIRVLLYVLGVLDVILLSYLTYHIETKNKHKYSKEFRDTYTLTIAFYTIVLFIFFKHEIGRINFSARAIKIINKLSSLTFGAYLTHMILKKILQTYLNVSQEQFFGIKFSPIIGCPILWVVLTVVSFTFSYILSKIPVLNKYIM